MLRYYWCIVDFEWFGYLFEINGGDYIYDIIKCLKNVVEFNFILR